MWTYAQCSGQLRDDNNQPVATGYAGAQKWKNDPLAQIRHNEGPLPRGYYTIERPVNTKTHGPFVLWLEPDTDNQMFGRSAFGIHGDSVVQAGTASEGCIILSRKIRELIWASGDHRLQVIEAFQPVEVV